jgi:broad specificity phosphatase PhoE
MQAAATLLFVRHAAIDCSRNGHKLLCGSYNVPLSNEGRRQADLLRRRLASERRLDGLYVSPLRRAIETAEAAPENLRPYTRMLKSLAEIDCGDLEGFPLAAVRMEYPDAWLMNEAQSNEDFAWPGGETYRVFRKRVLRAVEAIARIHKGQRVLLVTHAGVINQVLGSIMGQSAARWEYPRPRNASITSVMWGGGQPSIACFDDCTHLETRQSA